MSLNKVLIMGNLTRDPELKATPSGAKVCNFSIATNYTFKDASGNKKEIPEYHNIVVWGLQAENSGKYLKKGSSAFVEGRIQTRSWDGPDGKKQYKTEIVADNVRFMSSPRQSFGPNDPVPAAQPEKPEAPIGKPEEFDIIDFGEDPNPDDIPF
jgi:single-strand DNA-binding protein